MMRYLLVLGFVGLLGGCALLPVPSFSTHAEIKPAPVSRGEVRELHGPEANFRRTANARIRSEVSMNADSAEFSQLLEELASKTGFSVGYAPDVDKRKKISVKFERLPADAAFKATAQLAGYALDIDAVSSLLLISKLPTSLPNEVTAENPLSARSSTPFERK